MYNFETLGKSDKQIVKFIHIYLSYLVAEDRRT